MTSRVAEVGFSQRVQLPWLEHTAGLQLSGLSRGEIEAALQEHLRPKVSVGGNATRGNREKVITILLRTWVSVPTELESFRNEGLRHLRNLPLDQHVAIHWGMVMVSYPFWAVVAETVGRLLRLQHAAAAVHVQRRLRERLGERETVARAARRVIRTFVDWGVLSETEEKGVYAAASPQPIAHEELTVWLLEAMLRATAPKPASLDMAVHALALFPFALKRLTVRALAGNSRLDVTRQGGDQDVVVIREPRGSQPVRSATKR